MKLALIRTLGGYLRLAAAASTVMLSCGTPVQSRAAAFDSPVGQPWDVVMSGHHQGLAVIIFADDGTFSVDSVLVPKAPSASSPSSDDDRGTGGDDGRTGISDGGSGGFVLPPHTNLFGHSIIPLPDTVNGDGSINHVGVDSGHWGFDLKGRLVGYYTDVSGYSVCVTNLVLVNNPITGGIDTNIVVECNRLTNAISFTGSVAPGRRLTLVTSTPDGRSVFTGVPVTTVNMPDLSGNWAGIKIDQGLPYNEFFVLTPNITANSYVVEGAGPGYNYVGTAILSKSGKFAMSAIVNPPTDSSSADTRVHLRAVFGSLNKRQFTFRTSGLDAVSEGTINRIIFNGVRTSVP